MPDTALAYRRPSPLARAFDLVFNPILVKELRATFRGLRFFYTHLVVNSLTALIFLSVLYFALREERKQASEVGSEIFSAFLLCEVLVTFLVFPAFGCTSIVSERQQKSIDLLLTTTLRPWQIVWGKFSAAMSYGVVFLFSTLPLVSLCFLFGGVAVQDLVVACVGILALAVLVNIFAIYVSAVSQNAQRAVSGGYAFLLLLGLVSLLAFLPLLLWRGPGSFSSVALALQSLDPENGFLLAGGLAYLNASWFWLFFLLATNRLQPTTGNRSTGLRIFALLFLGLGLALSLGFLVHNWASFGGDERFNATVALAAVASLLLLGTSLFSCEDRAASPRLRRFLERVPWPLAWIRLFLPGAVSGALFSLLLTVGVYAGLVFGMGSWCPAEARLAGSVGERARLAALADWGPPLVVFVLFANSLGLCLASALRREWLRRALLCGLLFLLALVPVVLYVTEANDTHAAAAAQSPATGEGDPPAGAGNLFVASPVLVFASTWKGAWSGADGGDGNAGRVPIRTTWPFPARIVDLFGLSYASVSALLLVVAILLGRRRIEDAPAPAPERGA
ncbi:MAG: ABC transporter permease [Planctomycetes bacterium]|nr:ABC transporter permease [Planctomycetota bacterium]